MAEELRESVHRETGLTCSAGVGPNRLLAKVPLICDKSILELYIVLYFYFLHKLTSPTILSRVM